ncbi:MAG TPA: cation:proton antiporter, partial [Candidatus Polarisedimenticolia bacterium]|nr:cation:proton antiporter [Candidatus Polarisedimenticolia bacterium]
AEIGVMLLMFTLGLEFDTRYFLRIKKVALGGGGLQILLTVLFAVGAGLLFGWPARTSLFLGCIVALSSTAVVLKSLMQQGLLDTLPGRLSVGILILQDLSVVPMMILLPIAGGSPGRVALELAVAVARAALLLAITFVLSRYLMPRFLHLIASGRSQELFLLVTLSICLGMAWLSHALGVSYALGAFLAGLILGGSEYAHQMTADLIPFRDVFSGVFFVAMGMLLDPAYVVAAWPAILVVLWIIVVGKTAITAAAVGWFGYPPPIALQVGINLAQVGEFSFLIASMGARSGLISESDYQVAIAASIMSMSLAPLLTRISPWLASAAARASGGWLPGWDRLTESDRVEAAGTEEPLSGHIVILGYGTVGRTLGDVLMSNKVPFTALEIDPTLVREARRRGHPIRYGDANSDELLRRAGVDRARILVITLPDQVMARSIVKRARRMNAGVYILVRGRRGAEDVDLYHDGADEVIHETFEVGVEILARILRRFNVSKQAIERQIGRLRSGRYEVFRREDFAPLPLGDVRRTLDTLRVEFLEIPPGSPLIGRSLRDAGIRESTGALVLAVVRDGATVHSPEAWFVLQEADTILVSGAVEQVSQAEDLLEQGRASGPVSS